MSARRRRSASRRREPARALDVGGEIAVAELNQVGAAERGQRRHEVPRLVAPAPAALRIGRGRPACRARCRRRARCAARDGLKSSPVLTTIGEPPGPDRRRARAPAWRRRRRRESATYAAGGGGGGSPEQVLALAAGPAPRRRGARRSQVSPRTVTAGRASAASPITARRPRDRVGEARPRSPPAAGRTDRSRRAGPTATAPPRRRWRGRRCRAPGAADAVGDDDADVGAEVRVEARLRAPARWRPGRAGSSSTRSACPDASRFDWSMPALAMTRPRRCATISTSGRGAITSPTRAGSPPPGARPCR